MLKHPWKKQIFSEPLQEVVDFEKEYGWFTSKTPLISCVTDNKKDVQNVNELLQLVDKYDTSYLQKFLTSVEIITKVLAYRNLQKDQEVCIPVESEDEKIILVKYLVDKVFDVWNGMPAYGLIPIDTHEATSILLFRGTDASLKRKGSWSSLISDVDMSGPGYTAFIHDQDEMHQWLKKVKDQNLPARIMGFSLGANLVYYTVLFEHDLLSKKASQISVAFNPPGVTKKLLDQWNTLDQAKKPPLVVFVTKNDLVSKMGHLFGDIYELSTKEKRQSLHAHVELICARPAFSLVPYNSDDHSLLVQNDKKDHIDDDQASP